VRNLRHTLRRGYRMMAKVNCTRCIHYTVTWDPKHPKGCKLLGFKTAKMPSATVYSATGAECLGFENKPRKAASAK
jgi:hypothetical protein